MNCLVASLASLGLVMPGVGRPRRGWGDPPTSPPAPPAPSPPPKSSPCLFLAQAAGPPGPGPARDKDTGVGGVPQRNPPTPEGGIPSASPPPGAPHSQVVFPRIWITHLAWRLLSLALKGRTLTATFTEAPAMSPWGDTGLSPPPGTPLPPAGDPPLPPTPSTAPAGAAGRERVRVPPSIPPQRRALKINPGRCRARW